ncbi:MAG TPA: TonB family protein [Rhizomicrobium sp.]|nr:TonB family protein [Rhizomicrobium sp.]
MERPLHELAALAAHGKKDRTASLGLVAGIHVVIISGLIAGLSNPQVIKEFVVLKATMIPEKVQTAKMPELPPIDPIKPLQIETLKLPPIKIEPPHDPGPIKTAALPPLLPPPTAPREIARTHTTPPYPALSQRMGEQGTTGLSCEIGVDGRPVACSVTKSSGSGRLDDAASSYVMQHYSWEPATREGKPVAGKTQLNVVWDLKNAS